jgi:hypothetical protein
MSDVSPLLDEQRTTFARCALFRPMRTLGQTPILKPRSSISVSPPGRKVLVLATKSCSRRRQCDVVIE